MNRLLLGVVMSGCGVSANGTLADISNPVFHAQLVPETDDNDDDLIQTNVSLTVYSDPMADTSVHSQRCPTISDEPAMFDQMTIGITSRGQEIDVDDCITPNWTTILPLGPEDGTSLTLPAGFGATFPPGVLGARIAHLTTGHPWTFDADETFQITWSSADDLATLALGDVIATWSLDETSTPIKAIAFDATTITLQMPDPLPAGDGVFDVYLDHILAETPTTCTGAIRCEASNPRRFDHVAHVD